MISASPLPALTTSPTRFPNIDLASGETCEIEPLAGSASSSPTIRNVCSLPSSRMIVTDAKPYFGVVGRGRYDACGRAPGGPVAKVSPCGGKGRAIG